MKKTTNKIQENYMLAKALVETLKSQAHEIEQAYIRANNIMNPDGKTPSHIWMIDDEEVFNQANEATSSEIDALGIYDAEQTLQEAEDALIEFGLSFVPAKQRKILRAPCFGFNGDYVHIDVRAKVIELVLKLDVSTVR